MSASSTPSVEHLALYMEQTNFSQSATITLRSAVDRDSEIDNMENAIFMIFFLGFVLLASFMICCYSPQSKKEAKSAWLTHLSGKETTPKVRAHSSIRPEGDLCDYAANT